MMNLVSCAIICPLGIENTVILSDFSAVGLHLFDAVLFG